MSFFLFLHRLTRLVLNAKETDTDAKEDPAQITEKFGLEAGLFKAMTDKNADGQTKLSSAKDLLAKYGSAYLITSITLSIISFTLCYVLIDGGVDVAALLAKVGIEVRTKQKCPYFFSPRLNLNVHTNLEIQLVT